jgi:hypothetical protein
MAVDRIDRDNMRAPDNRVLFRKTNVLPHLDDPAQIIPER